MLKKESSGQSGASGSSLQSHKQWHFVTNEQENQLLTPQSNVSIVHRLAWHNGWLWFSLRVQLWLCRAGSSRRWGGYMPHLDSLMGAWPPSDSWRLARCSGHRGRWHLSRGHYGKLHVLETGWILFTTGRFLTGAMNRGSWYQIPFCLEQGVGEEGKGDGKYCMDRFVFGILHYSGQK